MTRASSKLFQASEPSQPPRFSRGDSPSLSKRGPVRRTVALIADIGIITALTGCSVSSSTTADCNAPFGPGDSSSVVQVSGDFGTKPTVTVPTPLKADGTQVSTLITGSGAPLEKGQLASIDYTLVNGSDGKVLDSSPYNGAPSTRIAVDAPGLVGLNRGLLCARIGSRVAIAVSPQDGLGRGGAQLGVSPDDTIVIVADITKASLARANGEPQPMPNGFPNVTLDGDGRPGLARPAGDPPTTLQIAQLKKGDGEVVAGGDHVVIAYTGWLWKGGTVFDSSWEKSTPVVLAAADGSTTKGGVIPGFAQALIGQAVGSQVMAIIPPDQGYGSTAQPTIPAGSTLIFVADILGKA
ncbi:peptidylprolyl isomerase [Rathayibacter toxicus]|nr:peptidylprolyl isomerase [Rathayibacter toxicus]PPG46763.1 peptidylprolyl isomerase [Rathayibacter toxicus]PPH63644.1 peptidylprolyl isomerase [Rathayibacter toxicus]PPH67989.1 peptidylprolyl isomerase [Rathayibacter toxicus]PPH72791.1 peptidylprolyl isomerase [Rathayibacter toxicus]